MDGDGDEDKDEDGDGDGYGAGTRMGTVRDPGQDRRRGEEQEPGPPSMRSALAPSALARHSAVAPAQDGGAHGGVSVSPGHVGAAGPRPGRAGPRRDRRAGPGRAR